MQWRELNELTPNFVDKPYYCCGLKHVTDRASCPARNRNCGVCGRRNHLRKVCRASRPLPADKMVNSVIVGAATLKHEPILQVRVIPQMSGVGHKVTAVADTGT